MKVKFGDKELTVGALNWAQLEELQDDIVKVGTMKGGFLNAENRESTFRVIAACIKRKHPEVSDEFIRANLDLSNAAEAIAAAFGANGFTDAKPGEATAAVSQTST